jgi:hypothetical protein
MEHLAQRAQRQQLLTGDPVEFDREGHARSDAEAREDPGAQAHRRGDLDDAHHVEEAFGPAEVGHECGTADSRSRRSRSSGRRCAAGPVGQLRAEAQQRRTSGQTAEEQVRPISSPHGGALTIGRP